MDAPPEVLSYFRARELKPAFSWLDVWGEEHAHAYTVAKVTDARILVEFKAAIDAAIAEGKGFEAFREDMRTRLTPHGWWGPREVADPEGRWGTKTVDFSAPRRLQVTFWSNIRAARAAGQWDRIQRTKRALPFLLYVRTTANDPRLEHLGWAGIILPVDHPWWRTHFPPNGWMCKCAVRQISADGAAGYLRTGTATAPDGTSYPIIYRAEPPDDGPAVPFLNRRTGEITHVPPGIDPGWHTNPGLAASRRRASADALRGGVESLADPLPPASPAPATPPAPPTAESSAAARSAARRLVRDTVDGPDFAKVHGDAVSKAAERRDAAAKVRAEGGTADEANATADRLHPWDNAPVPVAVVPRRIDALRGDASPIVTATDAAIGHSYAAHPTAVEDWRTVQRALDEGEIHVSDAGDRIWAFVEEKARTWMTVLVLRARAWRVLTHYPPKSASYREKQRGQPGRRVELREGEKGEDAGGGP
mgnify:CR=1 FL=1